MTNPTRSQAGRGIGCFGIVFVMVVCVLGSHWWGLPTSFMDWVAVAVLVFIGIGSLVMMLIEPPESLI